MIRVAVIAFPIVVLAMAGHAVDAADRDARCVVVETFVRGSNAADREVLDAVRRFTTERRGVELVTRFIDVSDADRLALEAVTREHHLSADRMPVVRACGHVFANADPEATVAGLRAALVCEVFVRRGCGKCAAAKAWLPTLQAAYPGVDVVVYDIADDAGSRDLLADLVRRHRPPAASVPVFHVAGRLVVGFDRPDISGPRLERMLAAWTRPCRVPIGVGAEAGDAAQDEAVDVPWLGRLDARRLGMPLFTIAIGLVDGFNPCAMWVLLLLLSILVNLRSRWRILAVAGTFVMVSGVAYFAFMAAWLNVFEWIGMLRPVQIALGLIAVGIGLVHVKDWAMPGRGPSLSIPEAAKPGIYARIRGIVTAENLPAAIAGAFVLAVLVNMVELLCTAGLPAVYTEILSQRGYPTALRYGYLGLYIAAYMLDDAMMVAAVTYTLSHCKLQATAGRWLKLVSGVVVLGLGLLMLVAPGLLEG